MIQNSAMLVDLNISAWTGRKMDKKVSDEIDSAKHTKARAGNITRSYWQEHSDWMSCRNLFQRYAFGITSRRYLGQMVAHACYQ